MLQTETDLFILGSYPSNQQDSDRFRLWEVAGTAHADLYTFLDNRFDIGTNPDIAAVVEVPAPIPGIIECTLPVNAGPQHFVANAAVHALNDVDCCRHGARHSRATGGRRRPAGLGAR